MNEDKAEGEDEDEQSQMQKLRFTVSRAESLAEKLEYSLRKFVEGDNPIKSQGEKDIDSGGEVYMITQRLQDVNVTLESSLKHLETLGVESTLARAVPITRRD